MRPQDVSSVVHLKAFPPFNLLEREQLLAVSKAVDREHNSNTTSGTGSMIAAQFQKQQEQRKQREEGGFTTKTMRELEKLKKQKVYSFCTLVLQFADGTVLQGSHSFL